jgi:ribosomal protein S18 acetylase RimI-like enzyme
VSNNATPTSKCFPGRKKYAMVQTSISAWLLTKPKNAGHTTIPSNGATPSTSAVQQSEPGASEQTGADIILATVRVAQSPDSPPTVQLLPKSPTVKTKGLGTKGRQLPRNATLAPVTEETLPAFRRMISSLLPVPYPDQFYSDILTDETASNISLACLWSESSRPGDKAPPKPRVVSGIRCRLLGSSPAATYQNSDPNTSNHGPSLYISTITTLAPYRRHGLADALLKRVTARAILEYGIATVTAHMWEANEDAREWYANHGFKEVRFETNYYRKLRPSGAWVLERRVGPQDLLGEESEFDP